MPLGTLAKGNDYLSTLWKQCLHHQSYCRLQDVSTGSKNWSCKFYLLFSLLCSDSMLSRKFSSTFADFTLAEFLSHFSLPISLGDLKELFENEVISWIIQNYHMQPILNTCQSLSGGDWDGCVALTAQTDCTGVLFETLYSRKFQEVQFVWMGNLVTFHGLISRMRMIVPLHLCTNMLISWV